MLRIKLRYDDVEAMVQRFAPNVGKSGLFLPTKSLQPVGAEVKFELRIADDTPVLVGLGRVKAARAPDPAQPKAAFGMAIELLRVTRESREVILKMLERRKMMGLPEVGIPMPADIDAARRTEVVDTQVRDTASAAVPMPTPQMESGPSEALLTAPRRQSGPIAVAKIAVVEALAPEAPRKPRPRLQEVIDRASGPIVSVVSIEGLDQDVDVPAVLARARMLAGGDLDAELDALREVAAAPLEITIEAASAELARQLGGKPVARRDRSARWEKPPAVIVDSSPAIAVPVVEVEAPAPPAAIVEAMPIETPPPLVDSAAPVAENPGETRPVVSFERARTPSRPPVVETPTPTPTAVTPTPTAERARTPSQAPIFVEDDDSAPVHVAPEAQPLIHDGADPEAFDEREAEAVSPEQIADEIHQLADGDYEEVEHTTIGAMPEEPSFAQHGYPTEPAVSQEIERSLEAQLAEAEAEADADDLGISGAYALPHAPAQIVDDAPEEAPAAEDEEEEDLEEIDDFEILAEADAEDADLLAAHGEAEASAPVHAAGATYAREADADYQHPIDAAFSDFGSIDRPAPHDDALDRALEPSMDRPLTPLPEEPEPLPRPSMDFVSRLELSDEFQRAPEGDSDPDDGAVPEPEREPRPFSGRHASLSELDASLGALEEEASPPPSQRYRSPAPFDEPAYPDEPVRSDGIDADSEQYTLAGQLPPADPLFDAPHAGYPRGESVQGFDRSDVMPSLPARQRAAAARATAPPPNEDNLDLESALEALDVDLDDLSVPHQPPQKLVPQRRPQRAERVEKPIRAATDDGVLIDFDDEE